MPILYHAPNSRSSCIVSLIEELGADIAIREVSVRRGDGTGAPDPANPHPEGKVPYLVDGSEAIRERGAIILHLTDGHPGAGLGPLAGEPGRGAYLSWLFWYHAAFEPAIVFRMTGLAHPALDATFRDLDTALCRLREALANGPWLLGERFSAADLLCASPFQWMPSLLPEGDALLHDWVARCAAHPATARRAAREGQPA